MTTSTIPDFEIRIQDLLVEYFTEFYEDINNYLDKKYKKNEELKTKWFDEHLYHCFEHSHDFNFKPLYEFKVFSDWLISKGEDCENLIGTVKNILYLRQKINTYHHLDCPLKMIDSLNPEICIIAIDSYRDMFVDEKGDEEIIELINNTVCPK